MKKLFSHLQYTFIGVIAIAAVSCKSEKLSDVATPVSYAKVSASLDTKLEVGTGSNYTLTGSDVTVPFTITFSSPTNTAFTLDLSSNVDTVAQLITAGTLPAGTVAFSAGAAAVTPQLNIPAGVKSFTTSVIVSRSVMEVNFGKNLAAVIKIGAVGKSNTATAGKKAMILVVKTGELLDANSVHEIAFNPGATNIINVISTPGSYTIGSQDITFTVPVTLQGDPGAEFTVDAVSVPDSVTKYINNGTLSTSVLYADSKITPSTQSIKMVAGSNVANVTFSTKINTLLAVQPAAGAQTLKFPTVALTLKNASKYKITDKTAKKTVYFVINPNFFRPYYGKPFLIKGTIGAASDPIYAAYYDFGGQGVAYSDNNTKDGDGGWRLPDFVDVSADYSPRSTVGWTSDNEYLTYSVNVEADGVYEMTLFLGSDNGNGRVSTYMDNVLLNPTQIVVNNTGSYGNQLPIRTNVTLTKGYHIFKLFWNRGSHDYRGAIFTRKS
jgi:hypothetical protein